MLDRRAVILGLPLAAAGCSGQAVWAPDDMVARARYRHPGPPMLTLYTVKNSASQNGAHTALLINADERVIFDPAGTFGHESIPERNDVVFGVTPRVEEFYTSYHARASYYVIKLHKEVTPEIADLAYRKALVSGPVAKANCTRVTSTMLRDIPGFESLRTTWFPDNLMEQFVALPGVTSEFHYEDDDDNKELARAAYDAEVRAQLSGVNP